MTPLPDALLRLTRRLAGWRRLPVWYHTSYRLPMTSIESRSGIDPRRADLVAWYLVESGCLTPECLRLPRKVSYEEMGRVHDAAWLEKLQDRDVLARIYGVDPWDVQVDPLLESVRHVVGGTVDATLHVLAHGGVALNLLGGFHHAAPARGSGLCPINDIAIAIAVARAQGLGGQVVVLDLDAHPPDGTAACLERDPRTWMGSLSGSDWGPLPGCDERRLPEGCTDAVYLEALDDLLRSMPHPDLALVLAGGDVLAGDRLGRLGLTLQGARERDRRVHRALAGVPSTWVSAGGYHKDAWRVLAGTALVLAGRPRFRIPENADPLAEHFTHIYLQIERKNLGPTTDSFLSAQDVEEALGIRRPEKRRMLGYYTPEGLEYALEAYGVLPHIRRLGYQDLDITTDRSSVGDLARLYGRAQGGEHLLMECVLQKRDVLHEEMLFIHWLTLRHPIATFSEARPRLPGQEVPGLGLAREFSELLLKMARRLKLGGVAFCPAWYHIAFAMKAWFRFVDPALQGRFEALQRDLSHLTLLQTTQAVAEGRVRLQGQPWAWESSEMAIRFQPPPDYDTVRARERESARFTVTERAPEGFPPPAQLPCLPQGAPPP